MPGWAWGLVVAGTAIVAFGAGVLLTLGGVFLHARLGVEHGIGPGFSQSGNRIPGLPGDGSGRWTGPGSGMGAWGGGFGHHAPQGTAPRPAPSATPQS